MSPLSEMMICPASVADGPDMRPLTPSENGMVQLVLRFANRICKVVDPALFYAAFSSATGCDISEGPLVAAPPAAPPSPGLRACYFALLCAANRFRGDAAAEQLHYRAALDCVDASMHQRPDEHLISALLLLTIAQFFSVRGDVGDAGALASLAQHLCGFVPGLCPDIAVTANCFSVKAATLRCMRGVVWPPASPPIGSSVASRTIEIVSFLQLQFVGFFQVESCRVPDFFALLDEATALEAEHGRCVPDLPIPPVAMATKALLSHREGHAAHQAVIFAAAALEALCTLRTLGLSTMYVFSQLLLAVPAICHAGESSCSPEVAAAIHSVRSAARRILSAPGGAFSAKPIAKHFMPTIRELGGDCASDEMVRPAFRALSPEASSELLKYPCPFLNPPPSAVPFLPRHPDPSSRDAAVLQALLRYAGEYRLFAEPLASEPSQWPPLSCQWGSAAAGSASGGIRLAIDVRA